MWGARTGGPVGGTQGLSGREGTDSWVTSYSTSPHMLGREHSVGAGTRKVPGATDTHALGDETVIVGGQWQWPRHVKAPAGP